MLPVISRPWTELYWWDICSNMSPTDIIFKFELNYFAGLSCLQAQTR